MEKRYDVIVPMTADNLPVFRMNVEWMKKNLSASRIRVIGAEGLQEQVECLGVEFVHEDRLVEGLTLGQVRSRIAERLGEPKRAGWYFQQFLKLAYAYVCQDDFYIVWDADTVPLRPVSHMVDGHPLFMKKEEMEPAYFRTLDRLFSGNVKRYGDFSFICENMIMNVPVMKEMLEKIMNAPKLMGETFWEKILSAVSDEDLPESGFSEFETYGNYVMTYYPELYRFRELHRARNGAEFFGMSPSPQQLQWASRSYDTIAFERWSYHHRILGWICGMSLVQTLVPFHVLVDGKRWISRMRNRGQEE